MSTTYTNIGLTAWTSGSDFFNHTQLANNFQAIDNHDHSAGKGLQVPTSGLQNLAVTGPKIAASAIDSSKILDGSIGLTDLASNSVDATKIVDGSVGSAELGIAAVTTPAIADTATLKAVGSFSAFAASAQSVTSNATGVIFDTEEWDISNWYDPVTGRYTPQIAGIYRLSWQVGLGVMASGQHFYTLILKNTSTWHNTPEVWFTGNELRSGGSALLQLNGSTDFVQIRTIHNVGSAQAVKLGQIDTYFQGQFVGR